MSRAVRFGLIGVGRWGKVYLRTLLSLGERCRISHLGTRNPENAKLVPYPVTVESDWKRVINSACEAVIIATPPQTHAEILDACVEAGKPTIVEKPLCLDVATAERLHQRIHASRVPVLVDHVHLFHPAYGRLRQVLQECGEAVRVVYSEGLGPGPIRADVSALWDWGPHDVSLCLDVLAERPVHMEALGGPRGEDGTPDQISLRLDFPSGACAWIHCGRRCAQKRRSLTVWTDRHVYLLDELAADPLLVSPVPGDADSLRWSALSPDSAVPPLTKAVRYFLDGLAGGDQRYFGIELALDVTRLLAKAEELIGHRVDTMGVSIEHRTR